MLTHRVALEVPGDVLADLLAPLVLTEGLHQQPGVLPQHRAHLRHRGVRYRRPVTESVRELAEQPRTSQAPPTDDHACAAGRLHHVDGVLGGPDVPVAQHWQRIEILDQVPDRLPVGLSGIHLLRSTCVKCDPLHALVRSDPRRITVCEVLVVDPFAHLDGHRPAVGVAHGRSHDGSEQVEFPGQRRSPTLARDFGDRTSHVEVDVVGHVVVGDHAHGPAHDVGIDAVQLDRARRLLVTERAHRKGLRVALHQGT